MVMGALKLYSEKINAVAYNLKLGELGGCIWVIPF